MKKLIVLALWAALAATPALGQEWADTALIRVCFKSGSEHTVLTLSPDTLSFVLGRAVALPRGSNQVFWLGSMSLAPLREGASYFSTDVPKRVAWAGIGRLSQRSFRGSIHRGVPDYGPAAPEGRFIIGSGEGCREQGLLRNNPLWGKDFFLIWNGQEYPARLRVSGGLMFIELFRLENIRLEIQSFKHTVFRGRIHDGSAVTGTFTFDFESERIWLISY